MKPTKKRRRKPRVKIPVWTSAQSHLKQTDLALFMNVAIRLALLCIATTGMGLLIVQAYEIPISHFRVGAWSFFAALFFNVVFLFLKFRYAFPAFAVLGWLYYRIADDILFDLRCFADYFLVYLDGSTLATARYAGRSIETVLYVMPLSFQEGLERSVIMLCVALALIFALSARGKFIGSILITAILVIIPAVAASKARYVPAMTLLAVGMLGLYSIWASQEQSFLKSAKPRKQRRSPFIPIIHRHGVNGAITAAIALIACILAQIIIPPEKTQSTIEFFSELSDKAIELSYEIGEKFSGGFTGMNLPALDHGGYMPSGSINIDSSLSINNPTISRTPIMNVYLENIANPVYLRNGIGAVFNPTRGSWDVNYSRGRNNMQNFPGNFYPEHEYVVFMQKTGALGYSLDSFFSRQTISVEPLVRSRPVMLPTSPYFPNYKTDSRLRASHDSILQKSSGTAPETFVWDVLYPKRRPTAELGFTDYLGRSQGDFAYALKDLENYILFSRPLTESEADLYDVPSEHEDYLLLSFNTSRPRQTFAPQFPDAGALRIYTLEYDLTAEEYLNQLKLYEEMVYEAYTETEPSETTNMIRLLVEAGILHSDSEGGNLRYHYAVPPDLHRDYTHAESLEQYLKYTYNYSLITDNNAGDNTMLGNFLFDTKSGHCALYATVMTLAMRELGLPARYVTGYVAGGPGAPLERAHDGNFVHVLRARDLHAWVEVYFQGVGWLPFDPTPPIYETAFNEAERARGSAPAPVTTPRPTPPPTPSVTSPPVTSPPVTTPATSPPITTPPDDVQNPDLEPPDQPETPPIVENKHKSTLPFQLLMILVILIVVTTPIWASVMFVKSVNLSERKRLAKYAVLEDDQTAREAYRFILRLLRLEGLTANPGETPVKFAERVDQAVQGHGLSPVITEIEKLEFSREELLAHEYEKLADCLTELYDRIITDKKALTRFVRRVIIFDVIK